MRAVVSRADLGGYWVREPRVGASQRRPLLRLRARVDSRRTAGPDALWTGSTLYIVSALKEGSTQTDARVLVYRFSFNGSSWSPIGTAVSITDAKPETLVLDNDSTGKLWLTYTANNGAAGKSVYVARTTSSETTWATPYVLPTPGADNLSADDVSTLIAYGNSAGRYVGVLYSNENDETLSFARHADGAGDARDGLAAHRAQ
jgi:hypothetical protein